MYSRPDRTSAFLGALEWKVRFANPVRPGRPATRQGHHPADTRVPESQPRSSGGFPGARQLRRRDRALSRGDRSSASFGCCRTPRQPGVPDGSCFRASFDIRARIPPPRLARIAGKPARSDRARRTLPGCVARGDEHGGPGFRVWDLLPWFPVRGVSAGDRERWHCGRRPPLFRDVPISPKRSRAGGRPERERDRAGHSLSRRGSGPVASK
jgi:hypothetical protein